MSDATRDSDGAAPAAPAAPDAIDAIEAAWRELRPDVDLATIAIVGRLLRATALTLRRSDDVLALRGLTRGEFDLLSALRRAGGPQKPSALTTVSLASPAATTKRLKALAERGFVVRAPDPDDGRGALIALTAAGVELVDSALPDLLERERDLLAGVPADRRDDVVAALRLLLASVEAA
jgi:DNA-binding MarR family transcriptional regulator